MTAPHTVASAIASPMAAPPARPPRSVRRTSHLDILPAPPPAGGRGRDITLRGRARDLVTSGDGSAIPGDEAGVTATLGPDRVLRDIATDPPAPGAPALVGLVVRHGFRAALAEAVAAHMVHRTPLGLLLDDLPVASLIAGYAELHGRTEAMPVPDLRGFPVDVCAGWVRDGAMVTIMEREGTMPLPIGPTVPRGPLPIGPPVPRTPLPIGPAVPEPAPSSPPGAWAPDPLAWHAMEPLAPGTMRRSRLVQVAAGDPLAVHAWFRDAHAADDGTVRVLHEYDVELAVAPDTLVVTHCQATPRVLPWPECPAAAASAQRLVGRPLGEVRTVVTAELRGTATCTHLNDLLRSLADAAVLVDQLPADA